MLFSQELTKNVIPAYWKEFTMSKIPFVLLIMIGALVITGCTGSTVTEPVVGTWQDTYIGFSRMDFTQDHMYHAEVLNDSYDGSWSKLDTNRYRAEYVNVHNNTTMLSAIIDYDPSNQSINLENAPNIKYARITDIIQGNWTDALQVSLMDFGADHSYGFYTVNNTYTGKWSKINGTNYVVTYSDPSNITLKYAQGLFYDGSNNTLQFEDMPYVYYTRAFY